MEEGTGGNVTGKKPSGRMDVTFSPFQHATIAEIPDMLDVLKAQFCHPVWIAVTTVLQWTNLAPFMNV